MIESVIKLKEGYFINSIMVIKINANSSINVSYDEKDISRESVNELLEEFFDI